MRHHILCCFLLLSVAHWGNATPLEGALSLKQLTKNTYPGSYSYKGSVVEQVRGSAFVSALQKLAWRASQPTGVDFSKTEEGDKKQTGKNSRKRPQARWLDKWLRRCAHAAL